MDEHDDSLENFSFRDYALEDYIAFIVFWVLASVVFVQFFSRYALNSSVAWTEEIARYLLIVTSFVGSIMAVRRNSHIFVEVFYRFIPRGPAKILVRIVDVTKIVFFVYAAWLSWKILPIMHHHRMVSVNIPMSMIYGVVFGSFVLMSIRAVILAWKNWREGYIPMTRPTDDPKNVKP